MDTFNFLNLSLYSLIMLNIILTIFTLLKLDKVEKRSNKQTLVAFTILLFFPLLGSTLYLLYYCNRKRYLAANID